VDFALWESVLLPLCCGSHITSPNSVSPVWARGRSAIKAPTCLARSVFGGVGSRSRSSWEVVSAHMIRWLVICISHTHTAPAAGFVLGGRARPILCLRTAARAQKRGAGVG